MSVQRISSTALLAAVVSASLSSAQNSDSAKAFLTSIYRHYENGGDGISLGNRNAGRYFTSSLLALVQADARSAGPENVGAIDADPICACQDWDGIWRLAIDVKVEAPGYAEAGVSFSLWPPQGHPNSAPRKLDIKLISEHGGWKIDDIIDRTDPKTPYDLRKALVDDIELNRRSAQPKR